MKAITYRINIFSLIIILTFIFAFQNYLNLFSKTFGRQAQASLDLEEEKLVAELAGLELSIYSTQAQELNQVRNDIMQEFSESDFASITIQAKASFIDTLLFDSKLKEFMNSSNLNKSNKSLLNKMKLYLPNELLIRFLPKDKSLDQIIAIEEYLRENQYSFLESNLIPSVKSNIKHYYFDKTKFAELLFDINEVTKTRTKIYSDYRKQSYIEFTLLFLGSIFLTCLIQLYDKYLTAKYQSNVRFLLKGSVNPRTYFSSLKWKKSISMIIVILALMIFFLPISNEIIPIKVDVKTIIVSTMISLLNIQIFIFKKERITL